MQLIFNLVLDNSPNVCILTKKIQYDIWATTTIKILYINQSYNNHIINTYSAKLYFGNQIQINILIWIVMVCNKLISMWLN
jgi:hypothetical protein